MFSHSLASMLFLTAFLFLLQSSQSKSVYQDSSEIRGRPQRGAKRGLSAWDLVSPYVVQQSCYAHPCLNDGDCCQAYACTGLRGFDRRARAPLRSCVLSLEDLLRLDM